MKLIERLASLQSTNYMIGVEARNGHIVYVVYELSDGFFPTIPLHDTLEEALTYAEKRVSDEEAGHGTPE